MLTLEKILIPVDFSDSSNLALVYGATLVLEHGSKLVLLAVVEQEVAEELDSQNLDQLIDEVASSEDLLDVVNRPPVIRLVNDMLFRALQLRASDIHVHPYESKIQIRYRIDGILYDVLNLKVSTRLIMRIPKFFTANIILADNFNG